MSKQRNELYEFGDFRLDVGERRLVRISGAVPVALPEKAFQTLVHLVRNPGTLITKDELLSAVWPETVVEENNLGKAIFVIRQSLAEGKGSQKYIETVPKHGYRFAAEVRRVEAVRAAAGPAVSYMEEPSSPSNGAALLGAGVVAVGDPEGAGPSAELAEEDIPNGRTGVSGSQAGATERSASLSRLAAFALVGILAAAGAVGIWWIYRGSPAPDAVQQQGTTTEDRSGSPAYDLYIRGKVRVASENREDTIAAIAMLEEAVARDPNLAKAYAALARGYNTMAFKYSTGADRKRWHENAEVAIEKALALEPDLAEVHFARGLILWSNTEGFPHEQAIQSYKRSLALDPNSDEAHHQLSFVYSHIGLLEEARSELGRALDLNPNNTLARYRSGVYAQYQGRFDEAIAVHKTIPRDFTPLLVDRTMAELMIQTGRADEAGRIVEDYLRQFPKDEGGSFTSVNALLLAKSGRHAEAEALIRGAEEIGSDFGHFHHTAYNIASAYAAMGRPEEAVQWLERTADTGFPNYPYFQIDPNLEPIRSHPRFLEFMSKLKPQWERFKELG